MLRPQHVEQKQPYVDDSCKLLLHFNGMGGNQQFIDSSNNTKVVTPYGNAVLSNTHYRFGGTSGYFDGSGDYLLITPSSDFELSNSNFTLQMWIYPTTATTCGIMARDYTTTFSPWLIYYHSDGTLGFYATDTAGSWTIASDSLFGSPILNTWNHIAIIRDGNSIRLYLNGSLTTTVTSSLSFLSNTNALSIGAAQNSSTSFTGYIDEVIIWKGISKPIGELYPQHRPYGYPIGGT